MANRDQVQLGRLHYYLWRHIDSDSHSPTARLLVERLCGDCLEARVRLWDAIQAQLPSQVPA